ncbi:MAG: DUF1573 domain-containing protein [Bacteroidales bacterium]|nr:DUF1573 domain-containing protein [Bacteroidales bacterium]
MKKILLTVFALVMAFFSFAQPKIQFDQTTYNFGQIREEDGKVTARFNFTNVGTEDLVLKSVRPGCGCTAANYTKTAVAPGQKGFIDATYNPANRPGSFNKNIKVTTNEPEMQVEKPSPHLLFIKGNVTPKPKTPFEKEGYTLGQGNVRFKNNTTKLEVLNTQQHLDTFQVKNFGKKAVEVKLNSNNFVSEAYRSFGPEIQPGEEGIVVLKYDAAKRNDFGTMKDAVSFTTNDTLEPKKELYYQVTITEDFSKLSAGKLKKAPVVNLSKTFIDFGKVKQNTSSQEIITLKNDGKSDLIIRKFEANSSNIKLNCPKMTLKKGESMDVTVTYNSKHNKGKQTHSITLITNDPHNSQIVINTKSENLQ